jgi:hypothetical protein
MDHEKSISTHAAEGYLLGELTPAERDAFEEHFFDCEECGQAVRDGAAFRDGMRALGKESRFQFRRPMWLLPIAASLAIGFGVGRIPTQPSFDYDHPMHSISVRTAVRAAAAEVKMLPAATRNYIDVEIPPVENAVGYIVTVRDGEGAQRQLWKLTPEDTRDTVSLPLRPLPPGGYELVIESADRGGKRSPIGNAITFNVVGSAR